jgi:hypothetical protein
MIRKGSNEDTLWMNEDSQSSRMNEDSQSN